MSVLNTARLFIYDTSKNPTLTIEINFCQNNPTVKLSVFSFYKNSWLKYDSIFAFKILFPSRIILRRVFNLVDLSHILKSHPENTFSQQDHSFAYNEKYFKNWAGGTGCASSISVPASLSRARKSGD